jgi:hypothetical protein
LHTALSRADSCPIPPRWKWNVGAATSLCKTDVRYSHPRGYLGNGCCPHQPVEILSPEIVSVSAGFERFQRRQALEVDVRIDTLYWDGGISVWRGQDRNILFTGGLLRIVDFVGNPLSGATQDAQSQLRDVVLVNAFDGVSDQEIHDRGINAELCPHALEVAPQIMGRHPRPFAAWGLADTKDPDQRLASPVIADMEEAPVAARVD